MIFMYKGPDTRNKMIVVPEEVLTPTTPKVPPLTNGLKEEVFYFKQRGCLANLKGRKARARTRNRACQRQKNETKPITELIAANVTPS